jgi:ribosomal protein S18 acetylase RimI-like enzyme
MQKMTETDFTAFRELTKAEYAKERSIELGIPLAEALAKAEEEVLRLLPKGMETPDHFFFDLVADGSKAGYLWFGVREASGKKRIFIFDISVSETFRGKGFSKFMLNWLETETRKMGLKEISLHVLGRNKVARNLYESSGFEPTSIYMAKKILKQNQD